MSDLTEMFKDMITRKPTSAADRDGSDDEDGEMMGGGGSKDLKQSKLSFGKITKGKEPEKKSSYNGTGGIEEEYPAPKGEYLADLVKKMGNRKIRIATMCSGTESPLLALGMISRQMKIAYGVPFEVDHVFSAEIEPYKQAYIERNFAPPILFRDVTELGGDKATTAYGAVVDIPGDVDILVAGTSCVDYSNLNSQKKGIDAKGESGNTFRGVSRRQRKLLWDMSVGSDDQSPVFRCCLGSTSIVL